MIAAYAMPDDRCPACGHDFNACAPCPNAEQTAPSPGDVVLCFECGEVLFFDEQLHHRIMPRDVFERLEPEFQEFIRVGQETTRERRRTTPRV